MGGCSALNCKARDNHHRLFRYPSDPARRRIWLANSGRENMYTGPCSSLCDKHFTSDQFEQNRQDGWKKLKQNAVPTIFFHKSSTEEKSKTRKIRGKRRKFALSNKRINKQTVSLSELKKKFLLKECKIVITDIFSLAKKSLQHEIPKIKSENVDNANDYCDSDSDNFIPTMDIAESAYDFRETPTAPLDSLMNTDYETSQVPVKMELVEFPFQQVNFNEAELNDITCTDHNYFARSSESVAQQYNQYESQLLQRNLVVDFYAHRDKIFVCEGEGRMSINDMLSQFDLVCRSKEELDIRWNNICRLCLSDNSKVMIVYSSVKDRIEALMKFEHNPSEECLPPSICEKCFYRIAACENILKLFSEANKTFVATLKNFNMYIPGIEKVSEPPTNNLSNLNWNEIRNKQSMNSNIENSADNNMTSHCILSHSQQYPDSVLDCLNTSISKISQKFFEKEIAVVSKSLNNRVSTKDNCKLRSIQSSRKLIDVDCSNNSGNLSDFLLNYLHSNQSPEILSEAIDNISSISKLSQKSCERGIVVASKSSENRTLDKVDDKLPSVQTSSEIVNNNNNNENIPAFTSNHSHMKQCQKILSECMDDDSSISKISQQSSEKEKLVSSVSSNSLMFPNDDNNLPVNQSSNTITKEHSGKQSPIVNFSFIKPTVETSKQRNLHKSSSTQIISDFPADTTQKTVRSLFKCKVCKKVCFSRKEVKNHIIQFHYSYLNINIDGNDCSSKYPNISPKVSTENHCNPNNNALVTNDVFLLLDSRTGQELQGPIAFDKNCGNLPVDTICSQFPKNVKESLTVENDDSNKLSSIPLPSISEGTNNDITSTGFSSIEDISKALSVEKETFKCGWCNSVFSSQFEIQCHLKSSHKKQMRQKTIVHCQFCKKFLRLSAYQSHLETHKKFEKSSQVCQYCKKEFRFSQMLVNHQRSNCTKIDVCMVCERKFSSNEELRQHAEEHSYEELGFSKCEECGKVILKDSLKKHMDTHRKPYLCSVCGEFFATTHTLGNHMLKHDPGNGKLCEECGRLFSSHKALHYHYSKCHGSPAATCGICHFECKEAHNLIVHIKRHFKTLTCDICNLTFDNLQSTFDHYTSVHRDLLPENVISKRSHFKFICRFCDKIFVIQEWLEKHVKEKHNGEDPYKCSKCNITFLNLINYKDHCKHCYKERNRLRCKFCGAIRRPQENWKHFPKCPLFPERQVCPYCNKRFRRLKPYQAHVSVCQKDEYIEV